MLWTRVKPQAWSYYYDSGHFMAYSDQDMTYSDTSALARPSASERGLACCMLLSCRSMTGHQLTKVALLADIAIRNLQVPRSKRLLQLIFCLLSTLFFSAWDFAIWGLPLAHLL